VYRLLVIVFKLLPFVLSLEKRNYATIDIDYSTSWPGGMDFDIELVRV